MRHGKALGKLSRNPLQRKRLLVNLTTHLFEHEVIQTTMARAKELRPIAEKVFILAFKLAQYIVGHHSSKKGNRDLQSENL